MKKILILIVLLLTIVSLQEVGYADNLFYFEILEADTSFKEIGGEITLNNGFRLKGDYNFSRINQYSIGLDISKANLSIMKDIFNTENLKGSLGIGYDYGSAHLSSTYFPEMEVTSKESGFNIGGQGEVKLDDKFSAFGEINFSPRANFRSRIEGKEDKSISNTNSKYFGKIGTKIKIADNLSGRVGYSFTRYKDKSNTSLLEDGEVEESLNNNQSGIFFGLETRF
ncbi:outer membrane beta-barrel protein [Halonatronum saccharophilum]|uniref:outer membrane beta-barrel protein n=1 Tax=Halonatronum saccharophilum TaxID=150060 RepID=UPI00047FE6CA|nr:outer membrane beta-barrel protein [Halonatronum saccharophilum]